MKKRISIIISFVLLISLFLTPFSALATDYGEYCTDTLAYPPNDVPDFSSLLGNQNSFLFYSGYNNCYYLVTTSTYSSTYNYYFEVRSGELQLIAGNCTFSNYMYNPASSGSSWSLVRTVNASNNNYTLFTVNPSKFKILFCDSKFNYMPNYVSSGNTYYITSNDSLVGSEYIIANSYNSYGEYLGDINNPNDTGNSGGGSGGESSYNDSSFKSLVSELFEHLIDVLLYGEDEDYDGTDVDDSIEWLDNLSEDMEDITDHLNSAPDYIENGFTALEDGQDVINDFFEGIADAVPILYYGINGILVIYIIRKIIGR